MEEHRSFFKVIGRFFCILFLIVLIPYFIVSCILTYSAVTNFENLPSIFGYKPVIIKNNEMKKDLYKGDLLIIKTEETYSLLEREDIITYKESTDNFKTKKISTVVSRPEVTENTSLEDLAPAEYRLKESSKEKADKGSIMSDQIEGVYFFRIPVIGTYLSYIENTWLLVVSLPVLGLLIVLFMMAAIKWAPKKVKKEEQEEKLELMSAAELNSGVNLREDLLKKANKKETEQPTVTPEQQAQPQVVNTQQPSQPQQPQAQVQQPQNSGGDFGGGIVIAPPTENNVSSQPTPQVPQQPVQQQAPQIQVVPPTQVSVPTQPFTQQPSQPQQPQPQTTVVQPNNNQNTQQ